MSNTDWESELWSLIGRSDGINCPIYQSCEFRLQGNWCLSEHRDFFKEMCAFVDDENPDINNLKTSVNLFCLSPDYGRMFKLIEQLVLKYRQQAGVIAPPVPADIITEAEDGLPIEVRQVPMNTHHGAVWQLPDCWLIHINSNDSPARQRFTIYHEIFHILAHSKVTPVFKKYHEDIEGTFNELLADHFAAVMLMPKPLMDPVIQDATDIDQIADLFMVPRSLVIVAMQRWGLTR